MKSGKRIIEPHIAYNNIKVSMKYQDRKEVLRKAGIDVSLNQLLEYYK